MGAGTMKYRDLPESLKISRKDIKPNIGCFALLFVCFLIFFLWQVVADFEWTMTCLSAPYCVLVFVCASVRFPFIMIPWLEKITVTVFRRQLVNSYPNPRQMLQLALCAKNLTSLSTFFFGFVLLVLSLPYTWNGTGHFVPIYIVLEYGIWSAAISVAGGLHSVSLLCDKNRRKKRSHEAACVVYVLLAVLGWLPPFLAAAFVFGDEPKAFGISLSISLLVLIVLVSLHAMMRGHEALHRYCEVK